ncbi:hypothetical protein KEM56_002593 [Ascosphaera pollenicola]|nr:hypothetical protein KEM56_002593 [Ascosphaera pollenicola]
MHPESSPISERSSLISKFTDRFNSRARVISDFYIEPDDPWRTYYSGDLVKGTVVLTVVKPLRITHLTVRLHGFAKVYRNTVIASETPSVGDHGSSGDLRARKGGEYMGNGYASLFEDDVSLCGEGRLKEGQFRFRFELEFPPQRLPSSINFERGTISYMITSTLTRPTTISPVFTCEKRLIHAETIDIGPLLAPKPRLITLEPVSRKQKSKPKILTTHDNISKVTPATSQHDSPEATSTSTTPTPTRQPPTSPAPSDQSHASTVSSSVQSCLNTPEAHPGSPSRETSEGPSSPVPSLPLKNQSITAMIELMRAGGLPGDVLPLKIVVKHTKVLRSTNGIIITFYRQGRVDWKPSTNNGNGKGKKPVREDAYPKSRTGLGVLSFGGARTNSLFRKDLSQTFAPLVVDPSTMKAAVNTSIRIPEDVFPTIKNVPGGMISFRYYVEIVMDLRGRLDRYLPTPAASAAGPASYSYSPAAHSFDLDQGRNITSTFGGNILDTDQIRREKSVVSCSIEVVIGTKDTSRKYAKLSRQQPQISEEDMRADMSSLSQSRSHTSYSETERESRPSIEARPEQPEYDGHIESSHRQPQPHESRARSSSHDYSVPEDSYPQTRYAPLAPPPESDEPADEKSRLRQAEETLLPSQPPDDASSLQHTESVATAPVMTEGEEERDSPPSFYQSSQGRLQFPLLNEDDDSVDSGHITPSAAGASLDLPLRQRVDSAPTSAFPSTSPAPYNPPPPLAFSPRYTRRPHEPSSYQYQAQSPLTDLALGPHGSPTHNFSSSQFEMGEPASADHQPPSEDKQELERRRLLAAASVPEPADDSEAYDYDAVAGASERAASGNNTSVAVPQGLTEEDFLHHTPATDTLPRYQQ